MTPTDIQTDIRLAVGPGAPNCRLFRNNRGRGWVGTLKSNIAGWVTLANARPIEFGMTNGASDLIGWTTIVVTPDLVGKRLAIFTAPEVKSGDAVASPEQKKFLKAVLAAGGIAGVVRNAQDAIALIRSAPGRPAA